ncbi:hypothetical protein CRYUN_Cryun07bG0109200 [Craigia yunnanensis]
MAEDWDLYAVVRSCTTAANTTTATASNDFTNENSSRWREDSLACLASLTFQEDDLFSFPNISQRRKSGSLQDSYKPFLPYADPTTISTNQGIDPSSSSSVPGGSSGQHHQHQRLRQQQEQPTTTTSSIGIGSPLTPTSAPVFAFGQSGNQQQPHHVQEQPQSHQQINPLHRQQQLQQRVQQQELQRPTAVLPLQNLQSQAPRSRKRKNQQKRTVCHVTADNLSSDPWAWRKYGQKPIKGSPYPRNYYRCSSSKGCSARKQVERSNLDPNIFIITYTGDHTHPRPTHRNSLAGSTRNKLSTIQKTASKDSVPETLPSATASCSSPRSATSLSPTTQLSVPEDTAAPVHNTGDNRGEEESVDMTIETAPDGESDQDYLLVPNVHVDEDLFKGLEELVSGAAAGSSTSGLGRSPAFGDNFSSWGTGNSAAGDGC